MFRLAYVGCCMHTQVHFHADAIACIVLLYLLQIQLIHAGPFGAVQIAGNEGILCLLQTYREAAGEASLSQPGMVPERQYICLQHHTRCLHSCQRFACTRALPGKYLTF